MPTIQMLGEELPYEAADIITFEEGLIGLPALKRMALVQQTSIAPFLWLASLDDPEVSFLVVDPRPIFPDYTPRLPDATNICASAGDEENLLVVTIVLIAPEWQESKINLLAPLFISPSTMRGVQFILPDGSYSSSEQFPHESMAA
jgi:flagellar assembly factor FliW